eukprot:9895092-Alexandrium_andersonii.AAC.1
MFRLVFRSRCARVCPASRWGCGSIRELWPCAVSWGVEPGGSQYRSRKLFDYPLPGIRGSGGPLRWEAAAQAEALVAHW